MADCMVESGQGPPRLRLMMRAPLSAAYMIPAAMAAEVKEPSVLALTGMTLVCHPSDANPLPLLVAAAMTPATAVP